MTDITTHDGEPFSPDTHWSDGVPKFSAMEVHIRAELAKAHDAHLAELGADPNRWPNPEAYRVAMKAAYADAIAQWNPK